jgi:hypothetical protein
MGYIREIIEEKFWCNKEKTLQSFQIISLEYISTLQSDSTLYISMTSCMPSQNQIGKPSNFIGIIS